MSYVAAVAMRTNRPLVSKGDAPAFNHAAELLDNPGLADNDTDHDIDLRQLRHHTKNTLQRILSLIAEAPGLSNTPAGEKIMHDLEYRISLSASISEALFGLTNAPGSMADRLRQLAGAVVEMMRDSDQVIRVGVSVRGCCPLELREAVLRSAHELLGNAVKHGMKNRPIGRITVRLVTESDCTTLAVVDNGWGFTGKPRAGEGLALAREFAAKHDGSLELDGTDGAVATLRLPHDSLEHDELRHRRLEDAVIHLNG